MHKTHQVLFIVGTSALQSTRVRCASSYFLFFLIKRGKLQISNTELLVQANRKTSFTLYSHDTAYYNYMPTLSPLHVRQNLLQESNQAEEVGIHHSFHFLYGLTFNRSNEPHSSIAHCTKWETTASKNLHKHKLVIFTGKHLKVM